MIRLRSQRIKIAKSSLVLSLIQVCLVVALRLNIIIEVINLKSGQKVSSRKSSRRYASSQSMSEAVGFLVRVEKKLFGRRSLCRQVEKNRAEWS